ncbi:MAG: sigma-54-dependent Fis family transcriptional regulator [Deltaproteobacteria bacterium]|nr:sigma-54-dependent Fis family transcriptional regulator [Deltaproteobacteria bacterium]
MSAVMSNVLVVDDDPSLGRILIGLLDQEGFNAIHVPSGADALTRLERYPVDVVLTDLRMPQMDGLSLLGKIRQRWPDLPVLMLTAHGSVATVVEAMRRGATGFLTKPFVREEILFELRKATAYGTASGAGAPPSIAADTGLLGDSPAMNEVRELIDRAAASTATVLVRGESGTGKERVVEAIHARSARHAAPLIKLHCAALPDSLIEDELFGHERGAFTGAVVQRIGRFELAAQGTIFLDEIGDISSAVQVRLLRVLQTGEFERVGGSRTLTSDARVIAATHRDLEARCRQGVFREDLFYRLNVIPIWVPPLREREDDVLQLVTFFADLFGHHHDRQVSLSDGAIEALRRQPWPGNVRELRNFVERLIVLARDTRIDETEVRRELARTPLLRDDGPGSAATIDKSPPWQALDGAASQQSLGDARRETERLYLIQALKQCNGNRTQAARISGVSRRTFYNLLQRHNLDAS